MKEHEAVYLADGVYAESDGEQVALMTGSHSAPDTVVYLDADVLNALRRFLSEIEA